MSPIADPIIRRLDATRQQWWLFTLLTTCVLAATASFGVLLVFMLADALLKFSQIWLAALFVGWLAATIAMLVIVGRRLVRSQRTLEATARRVEAEMPELGSNLMNLVQLADDRKNENQIFCEAAVRQAASHLTAVPFDEAARRESRWRRFLYCMQTPRDLAESVCILGVLTALAVLCHMLVPNWGSAANRLMTPWEFVPSVGKVEILRITPDKDIEVIVGSSLPISAEIRNPEGRPYPATLFVTTEGEEETSVPMTADEKNCTYRLTIPSILKPLHFRVEIGDSQTDIIHVTVREKPTINEVEVTFNYPAYLGKPSETFVQKQPDLEAPQYTLAALGIRPSVPVVRGYVMVDSQRYDGAVEQGGALVNVRFPLLKDGTFSVHLESSAGSDPNPRANRIHVLPDRPPTVELLKPPRQASSAPGGEVPVMIRAGDDHGLGHVRLEMKVKPADAQAPAEEAKDGDTPADATPAAPKPEQTENLPSELVQQWDKLPATSSVTLEHKLVLDPKKTASGQTVLVRAVVRDKRDVANWGLDLKPQEAASAWHSLQLISAEAKATAAFEQLDNLRNSVFKILEKQIRARLHAGAILNNQQLAQRTEAAGTVRGHQVDIQKLSVDLVKAMGEGGGEERTVMKRILNNLAFGEMLEVVRQCDELVKIQTLDGFAQPVPQLTGAQDRIIDILRKLLDVARQAQTEALAEMKNRTVSDLPDDTKKKLEEAKKKLDELLKQQKKVIEASENLAKMPVEDFTKEEEEKLKALAASQDEFSKFMKELASDLSKLPEQDFANSSLAKELVEIQTELKMAEDALLKKTADIAVPLEQLGYERAETISTNIEKWLPDTPDRERWSQEESPSDADKEAPMAELPGELEDLIGDLMEQEEDLFDEMEDISSSAADSADKGVGWDAVDGPISNMSAKGVTGNRLPNTNELGGRAGEGRQGKSSGEFVGDEAVGKGGRKTPSRLTPDPYVKGQVKDHSKDPVGGATGGGKESGQGGEGLEGPGRRPPGKRDLQRLAGKQASLRNKAEGIDLQFQVGNFHRTDLKNLIELMAQVERDLKAGRYQNVLRQRKVLVEGMANVKQYLEGEFEVRQDATANLPSDIQKEILGSMQDPSPTGWEELNRQYFERLSTSGAGASSPAPAEKPAGGN